MSKNKKLDEDENDNPPNYLINITDYLYKSIKVKQGIFNDKRVNYFKGKTLLNFILNNSSTISNKLPSKDFFISNKEDAIELISSLLDYGLIIRCDKQDKFLLYHPSQAFSEDSFYLWLYTGSQLKTYLFGFAVVAGVFAGVLFPLWPATLRTGVYYLSLGCLGLLGLLMIIAVIRLILWIFSILTLKRGFWLFPNLFADVGIIESFIPFYGWETDEQYSNAVESVNQKYKDKDE